MNNQRQGITTLMTITQGVNGIKCMMSAIAILMTLTLSACVRSTDLSEVDTANLRSLESIEIHPYNSTYGRQTTLSPLRSRSLRDTAMSLGAQGGLAWASERINQQLRLDGKILDSIYNFNALVLHHGVMPPVLEQGDSTLNLADPTTIRVADRTYKIVKQAHFATTPPNWREYLWLAYTKPDLPDKTLMPRNRDERRIWSEGIRAGWEKGIEQAFSIFHQSIARLKRDYRGMLLYRKLLEEKMISPPFVSRTELGVTGNGEDMNINDQVLRIVELPRLQTDSERWNAIIVKK